jgi:chromate transporter
VLFGKITWVAALFVGLKPAVIAIVILALIKIGKKSLQSVFHYGVALFSFVLIFFFNISFPFIIVVAIVMGWIGQKYLPSFFITKATSPTHEAEEKTYYLNAYSLPISMGVDLKKASLKILVAIVLGLIPLTIFYLFRIDFSFWLTLSTFFTKAAFVTFGGAYAVLPYVAQESVEKLQWLSQYEMIDGLALGETTPGPLIIILVYVGFMAAFNQTGSLWDGTLGLVTTAFYTFLPSFVFILVGAPVVEQTKDNAKLKSVLSIVTAAVVGVILNLTLYLGNAVIFPSGIDQGPGFFSSSWLVISLIVLYRFKLSMVLWIGISATAGLLYWFV